MDQIIQSFKNLHLVCNANASQIDESRICQSLAMELHKVYEQSLKSQMLSSEQEDGEKYQSIIWEVERFSTEFLQQFSYIKSPVEDWNAQQTRFVQQLIDYPKTQEVDKVVVLAEQLQQLQKDLQDTRYASLPQLEKNGADQAFSLLRSILLEIRIQDLLDMASLQEKGVFEGSLGNLPSSYPQTLRMNPVACKLHFLAYQIVTNTSDLK